MEPDIPLRRNRLRGHSMSDWLENGLPVSQRYQRHREMTALLTGSVGWIHQIDSNQPICATRMVTQESMLGIVEENLRFQVSNNAGATIASIGVEVRVVDLGWPLHASSLCEYIQYSDKYWMVCKEDQRSKKAKRAWGLVWIVGDSMCN